MSVELGAVSGLIELTDNFTGQIGLAKSALSNFSAENQASMKAVAGAAGLVVGALAATTAAVVALGLRGADVNDVKDSLEHFAGSAEGAEAAMSALRTGTKNTVDNFELATQATHLLSSGVKLTADQFGILGTSAAVLSDRGLGDTKDMLDMVNDAMVTGKTKSLEMAIGVIDTTKAQDAYAAKLGVTRTELTETGKVEANRTAIMEALSAAVKDAGAQEMDFADHIASARVAVQNWMDDLGSAIAASPVLAAGMEAISKAVKDAFGGSNSTLIQDVVAWIGKAAIMAVDFGLGAIEMARVVNVAWSAVKTAILAVETMIVGAATMIVGSLEMITRAGEALHIVPEGTSQGLTDLRVQLVGMTDDLQAQTIEAAKGMVGASEFDKTLDKLGGTLFVVRDAMVAASQETVAVAETQVAATKTAAELAAEQAKLAQASIDLSKVEEGLWKIEKKSLEETADLWDAYFAGIVKGSGTTHDALIADIEAEFTKQVGLLDEQDRNFKDHYDALRATANQALAAIGSDWDRVKDLSIEALGQERDKQIQTYKEMTTGTLHFTNEVLEAQRLKVIETTEAARGFGKEFVAAQNAAAAAAQANTEKLEAVKKAADEANRANMALGQTTQVTRATWKERGAYWFGEAVAAQIEVLLKEGFSLQNAQDILRTGMNWKDWKGERGPRVPGFAQGGMVDIKVGEFGPEAVRVPRGSTVFPTGTNTGGNLTLNFHVNGTAVESARAIKQILMRELKAGHQFGSA